jgi:AraC-like DNA-binding protein
MKYQEIVPGERLRQYIKCYYIYESASPAAFEDTVFPSGCMEVIFNLGTGKWQTATCGDFVTTPPIEFWGQIIRPLSVRSTGSNTMLGIRFFPYAAACFVKENIEQFNNQVVDFGDLWGSAVRELHERLLETAAWDRRIALVEDFLLSRIKFAERRSGKVAMMSDIMRDMKRRDFLDNIESVATRYGITSRYLQKLFLQYTGLTPKLYTKINRFQNSLRLVCRKEASLTAIAYNCGYFDQSHFIREFKSFTGLTPSGYVSENSPITLALTNN